MDLFNHEWEQFIHAGSEGSFSDWLVRRLDQIATIFEERLEKVSARLDQVQHNMVPQERLEILRRENQSLHQQLEFERTRNAGTPDVGQPRPERWVSGTDQTAYGPRYDPHGGRDEIREQERAANIRRILTQLNAYPQDSDSG